MNRADFHRIDSHQHFWRYSAQEYPWIDDTMQSIRRDFLPPDLKLALDASGFAGSIAVQARQTLEETHWLLSLAGQYPDVIRGVVGWVPLLSPQLLVELAALTRNQALKGVRHVLQGEPDERFMLRADFNLGISQLLPWQLVYDILILERHLLYAIQFVDLHPQQVFVLDHIAKPKIAIRELEPWAAHLRQLAKRPNVYCKLSGLATEAGYQTWQPSDLLPYMDHVLECFGPGRLLFGSDWPVCLVATSYSGWSRMVHRYIETLSPSEQQAILGGTARRVYQL